MIVYNNEIVTYNNNWIGYNLGLPAYTAMLLFTTGVTPVFTQGTAVQVSENPNIWNLTYEYPSWYGLLKNQTHLLAVLRANTIGVTDMSELFYGCKQLNSVVLFDTSSVRYMNKMFADCEALESVPLFNTSNVISMGSGWGIEPYSGMFDGCINLKSVPLFNTSKVTSMDCMFAGCSSLTTVPLFNTSSVLSMDHTFWRCSSLTSVPLFNTSNVGNMRGTFRGCSSLTTVPLFNTSNVTNMGYHSWAGDIGYGGMFQGCTSLTSVPNFDTSKVEHMRYMFKNCTSLTTIPEFNTESCYDLKSFAEGCIAVTAVPQIDVYNPVVSAEDYIVADMFKDCVNVVSGALDLYNAMKDYEFTEETDHADAFLNCGYNTISGYAELEQIPASWGGAAAPAYNLTYATVTGGTLSGPATAYVNSTVNVTATPSAGMELNYLTVNGDTISGTSFSMPAQDSVVSGVFREATADNYRFTIKTASTGANYDYAYFRALSPTANSGRYSGSVITGDIPAEDIDKLNSANSSGCLIGYGNASGMVTLYLSSGTGNITFETKKHDMFESAQFEFKVYKNDTLIDQRIILITSDNWTQYSINLA